MLPAIGRALSTGDDQKTEAIYRRYAITDRRYLAEGVEKLARLHQTAKEKRVVIPIRESKDA